MANNGDDFNLGDESEEVTDPRVEEEVTDPRVEEEVTDPRVETLAQERLSMSSAMRNGIARDLRSTKRKGCFVALLITIVFWLVLWLSFVDRPTNKSKARSVADYEQKLEVAVAQRRDKKSLTPRASLPEPAVSLPETMPAVLAVVKVYKNSPEYGKSRLIESLAQTLIDGDPENLDFGERGEQLNMAWAQALVSKDEFALKDAEDALNAHKAAIVSDAKSKLVGKWVVFEIEVTPQSYDFDKNQYVWVVDTLKWTDKYTTWMGTRKQRRPFVIDQKLPGLDYYKVKASVGDGLRKYFYPQVWVRVQVGEDEARKISKDVKSFRYFQLFAKLRGDVYSGVPSGIFTSPRSAPKLEVLGWRLCQQAMAQDAIFSEPIEIGDATCTTWVGGSKSKLTVQDIMK